MTQLRSCMQFYITTFLLMSTQGNSIPPIHTTRLSMRSKRYVTKDNSWQQDRMSVLDKLFSHSSPSQRTSGTITRDKGRTEPFISPYQQPPTRYQCYSCMSQMASPYWKALKKIYEPQMSFTDDCGRADSFTNIGAKPCNTTCLTLKYTMNLLGLPAVPLYIRGCASEISIRGFTNETKYFVYQSSDKPTRCRWFSMFQLFRGYTNIDIDSAVKTCPCLGDRCNTHVDSPNRIVRDSTSHTHNTTTTFWTTTTFALLWAVLLIIRLSS